MLVVVSVSKSIKRIVTRVAATAIERCLTPQHGCINFPYSRAPDSGKIRFSLGKIRIFGSINIDV